MPVSGLDYLAPVRSFRNFFGRYGTTVGAIRGVWNGIIPVAVVDRYRDDTEGSLFGINAVAIVPANRHPAFAFGSPSEDWELLSCNFGTFNDGAGITERIEYFVYTPDATYTPVDVPSPAVFWTPGLNLDWSFTLSSVTGLGGHNAALPPRWGFHVQESELVGPGQYVGIGWREAHVFDPPLRVYRDVTLGFIQVQARLVASQSWCDILYRMRPRTTDGPRTG